MMAASTAVEFRAVIVGMAGIFVTGTDDGEMLESRAVDEELEGGDELEDRRSPNVMEHLAEVNAERIVFVGDHGEQVGGSTGLVYLNDSMLPIDGESANSVAIGGPNPPEELENGVAEVEAVEEEMVAPIENV
jgi:hypothetical protein